MKRPRHRPTLPRLSRDAERLVQLAQGLNASGSRVEDLYWEHRIGMELDRLLDHSNEATLENALNYLFATQPDAYDALIDLVEGHAESVTLEHGGRTYAGLLVAVPILARSQYSIPSGRLRPEQVKPLQAQLQAHVAAQDAHIAVSPYLYSIEQLPRGYATTRALTRLLTHEALEASGKAVDTRSMTDTAPLQADTRYLLAVFAAPDQEPLFSWQEETSGDRKETRGAGREQALERWRAQGVPNLAGLMTGCVFDVLIPDGYHVACREADQMVRPYIVQAALAFLETAAKLPPAQLRAVVAPFGNERIEEYRIAFTPRGQQTVVHGVVWQLYGREEGPEPDGPQDQINLLLRSMNVGDVVHLDQQFPPEFCDDCGAPLFADPLGELVHAEMPEDVDPPRAHLH